MGWLIAAMFAVLTFTALYLSKRCSRQALELAGAAILIALAGYGWQGSPDLPGNPVSPPAVPAN
jgi:cytochrome c-type biogenesis protein CcmH